jgi:hypothetical protein
VKQAIQEYQDFPQEKVFSHIFSHGKGKTNPFSKGNGTS